MGLAHRQRAGSRPLPLIQCGDAARPQLRGCCRRAVWGVRCGCPAIRRNQGKAWRGRHDQRDRNYGQPRCHAGGEHATTTEAVVFLTTVPRVPATEGAERARRGESAGPPDARPTFAGAGELRDREGGVGGQAAASQRPNIRIQGEESSLQYICIYICTVLLSTSVYGWQRAKNGSPGPYRTPADEAARTPHARRTTSIFGLITSLTVL